MTTRLAASLCAPMRPSRATACGKSLQPPAKAQAQAPVKPRPRSVKPRSPAQNAPAMNAGPPRQGAMHPVDVTKRAKARPSAAQEPSVRNAALPPSVTTESHEIHAMTAATLATTAAAPHRPAKRKEQRLHAAASKSVNSTTPPANPSAARRPWPPHARPLTMAACACPSS